MNGEGEADGRPINLTVWGKLGEQDRGPGSPVVGRKSGLGKATVQDGDLQFQDSAEEE